MDLIITSGTWLKARPVQSSALKDAEKTWMGSGSKLPITAWSHADAGHLRVVLKDALFAQKTWLVYDDHCTISGAGQRQDIRLNVPYYMQRDNKISPMATCNSSSHAMLLNYLKPKSVSGDDEYIERFVKSAQRSVDWAVHTRALEQYGIVSEFRTTGDYADLDRSLEAGIPVVIGVLHKGPVEDPSGGHVLVIVGRYNGGFLAHDPFGVPFEYSNKNGAFCKIPRSPSMDHRWEPGHGYWRRVISINGKATGL